MAVNVRIFTWKGRLGHVGVVGWNASKAHNEFHVNGNGRVVPMRADPYLATYHGTQVTLQRNFSSPRGPPAGTWAPALIADSEVQNYPRGQLEKLFTSQSPSPAICHRTYPAIHNLAPCSLLTRSVSPFITYITDWHVDAQE